MSEKFDFVWRVRTRLPDRFGTRCRVLVRGAMNSCLVKFESDGYEVITSRNYLRKPPVQPPARPTTLDRQSSASASDALDVPSVTPASAGDALDSPTPRPTPASVGTALDPTVVTTPASAGTRSTPDSEILILHLDGKLPNLALMRLAAFHRAAGHHVEIRRAGNPGALQPRLGDPPWSLVYGSLIFTATRPLAEIAQRIYPGIVLGGTGWDLKVTLPPEVEACAPDYTDYPQHRYSIGFTQRGCRLECRFCVVPIKEGKVRPVSTLREIWRGDPWPRQVVLLDNDFFGNPDHEAIIAEAREHDFEIALVQGINARMLSVRAAKLLASIKIKNGSFTRRRVYTAWDGRPDEHRLFRGLRALVDAGFSPDMIMVYTLIGEEPGETHADRDYRRRKLREFGCRPYPMPYVRDGELGAELVAFQRWVVQRADLHVPWEVWWGKAHGEPRKIGKRVVTLPLFSD